MWNSKIPSTKTNSLGGTNQQSSTHEALRFFGYWSLEFPCGLGF